MLDGRTRPIIGFVDGVDDDNHRPNDRQVMHDLQQQFIELRRQVRGCDLLLVFRDGVGEGLLGGIAKAGEQVVVMAGVPFRTPGSTNVIHVTRIVGDELKNYD